MVTSYNQNQNPHQLYATITHITSGTRTTFYSAIEFAENNCCIKLMWILVLVIRGYHKKK
jgi:hypothetical protein